MGPPPPNKNDPSADMRHLNGLLITIVICSIPLIVLLVKIWRWVPLDALPR